MKILCVIPTYVPAYDIGGPVKTTHDLCRTLVKKGIEVSVYTTDLSAFGRVDVPIQDPVDIDGVNVTYFSAGEPVAYNYAPSMGKALMENVSQYDLVHIHSIYLYPTLVAARVCRKENVPYIINPFGALDPDMINLKNAFMNVCILSS